MSAQREMTKDEKLWRGTLDMVSTVGTMLWARGSDEKNKNLFRDELREYLEIIEDRCKAINKSLDESNDNS